MLAGAQYNALTTLHSTPCWLVRYYQCADWRAVCVSPRVAREARAARLSVNPAAHGRRGSCSTGRGHRCGKAPVLCFAFARDTTFGSRAAELYLFLCLAAAYSRTSIIRVNNTLKPWLRHTQEAWAMAGGTLWPWARWPRPHLSDPAINAASRPCGHLSQPCMATTTPRRPHRLEFSHSC